MTVVRLSNGDLFLQSPIKFDEALASDLQRMGIIRHLVTSALIRQKNGGKTSTKRYFPVGTSKSSFSFTRNRRR